MEGARSLFEQMLKAAPEEITALDVLWQALERDCFPSMVGPYPASHGRVHVLNVVRNLAVFVGTLPPRTFSPLQLAEVVAAAMIHDVGMIRLRQEGAYGKQSEKERRQHARREVIEGVTQTMLSQSGFSATAIDNILDMAAAHAADDEKTAAQKAKEVADDAKTTGRTHLELGMQLVRASDFFDIGPDRLARDVAHLDWREPQTFHLKKHGAIRARLDGTNREVGLSLRPLAGRPAGVEDIERFALFRVVHDEAARALRALNGAIGVLNVHWGLSPVDEDLFGRIYPLSGGIKLFGPELEAAVEEILATGKGTLEVDMMGHSLYQRFVGDAEHLNERLCDLLSQGRLKLRVLLVDPSFENQQAYEVFEAQRDTEDESGRSILPRYDQVWEMVDEGDIHDSLRAIKETWVPQVRFASSVEVCLTRRLMYASITRFGNRMVVTPYRSRGLFSESLALLLTPLSPLFEGYQAEFNSTWMSPVETRLHLHVHGDPGRADNPIRRLRNCHAGAERPFGPFDFERSLLQNHFGRLAEWFEGKRAIPPFEVEVQPSAECDLSCKYCIGQHLAQPRAAKASGNSLLASDVDSVFDYKVGEWKVERIRLSGLLGDPLAGPALPVSLGILDNAKTHERQVVILTSGVALGDEDVRKALLAADYLHVSLDAANADTFSRLKGSDSETFDQVVRGLRAMSYLIGEKESSTVLGVGFVVTQENAEEVGNAVQLAEECGVKFIRFKPDIRGPTALSWRTWNRAREKIAELQRPAKGPCRIVLTDVPWHQYRVPTAGKCWCQLLCATIGPDARLYPCDHLTAGTPAATRGSLKGLSFKQVWESAHPQIGKRCPECLLCPPFAWRVNELAEELFILYQQYDRGMVKKWINDALGGQNE